MKVVLLADVKDVGEKGNTVNVSDGYARNFLFPKKLAKPLTDSTVKALKTEKKDKENKEARLLRLAKEKAEKLSQKVFKVKAKAGEGGKLYGSITSQDIADAVAGQSDFQVDKKKILLEENLKMLGKYQIKAKVHPSITATITVEVIPEEKKE